MKFKVSQAWWLSIGLTLGLVLLLVISTAAAQGPSGGDSPAGLSVVPMDAFTYQGRLLDGGQPANGAYDFRFTIMAGKGAISDPQLADDLPVSDGLFTVYLQPGALNTVFTGLSTWLLVEVRSGNSTGAYTSLPLQPITPAPYAAGLVPGTVVQGGIASPSAVISVTQTSYGAFGIYGRSNATGIYGRGDDTGVQGFGLAYGVKGESGNIGVYGYSAGNNVGVLGNSNANGTGVSGSSNSGVGVYGSSSSGVGVYGSSSSGVGISGRSISGNPLEAWSLASYPANRRFYVSNAGNVYADGSFNPGGADFAEMLPAVDGLEPGDVLVIGSDGRLTRSRQAAQTNVAGVYSTQPGFVGSVEEDAQLNGKIPLAVVGVVPVKATIENGAIHPGDLLVTSSTPGYAMRAKPITVNGATFYPGGILIGKALEELKSGQGSIKTLVSLH